MADLDRHDLVGAHPGTGDHPAVRAVTPVLEVLATQAGVIDVDGVRREHLDALAGAGFFRAGVPVADGGAGAPPEVQRELVEQLAAASGSVWFVATQHRSPMEAARQNRSAAAGARWRDGLVSGTTLGAVAFAHIRRAGPPSVTATRTQGGWRVDGRLDWLTSWGLADVVLLMAETADHRVVQALLPLAPRDGWVVTGPLQLAAMSATSTVGVVLDGVLVRDDEVVDIVERAEWLAADAHRTANVNPATFGLLRAVVDDLHRLGSARSQPRATEAAETLAHQTRQLRARAYSLIDSFPDDEAIEERLQLRSGSLQLALRATAARIAAEGGFAMTMRSPAQRWAREAMFHLVQAQTQPLREALLAGFAKAAADAAAPPKESS